MVYQQKDSLAKKENPVAFSLGEEGLKWLGEYDISIEDLLMGKAGTKKETKLEKAQKLILELLNQTESNVFRRIRGRTTSLWDFFQNRKRCKKTVGKQIELRLVSGKKNSCVNHRIKDDIGKKLLWHWQSL